MVKRKERTHLINVQDLQEIVKLVAISGFLSNHKPLSMLLVGKVGHGKTEITGSFEGSNMCFLSDISSSGVYKILENKRITHIIIADFTKITMKARQTSKNLMTTLNSAMEEGLFKQELKGTSSDLKGRNIGVITSTTKASFGQNKKSMEDFGLTSRFIIVSFDYSDKTISEIMQSIYNCEYLKKQYVAMPLKKNNGGRLTKKAVYIRNTLAEQLNAEGNNAFRTQKQLQTLACCSALADDRTEVTYTDIQKVLRLTKFMNLKYTKI